MWTVAVAPAADGASKPACGEHNRVVATFKSLDCLPYATTNQLDTAQRRSALAGTKPWAVPGVYNCGPQRPMRSSKGAEFSGTSCNCCS